MNPLADFIRHGIWVQRYASHEVNVLVPFIEQMRDEIRADVLAFGDDSRTKTRLTQLLKGLEGTLYSIANERNEVLQNDIYKFAEYESGWAARTLTQTFNINFTTPTPEQVLSAARFNPLALNGNPVDYEKLLNGWEDTEISRLVTGVKSGFVRGETTRDIVKKVVGPGGLADVSERNAATVVRTALNHVSTQAKDQVYKRNDDVISGYRLVVTLDSRTSAICRGWPPGKVYHWEDAEHPLPPFHPMCRTTTDPVVDDAFSFLDKGAKRAAKGADGGTTVRADMSYYEFLSLQPAWFQDEVLGKTRGLIFRNSGMTPEEFRAASVDSFGRPLTLKEMAELDDRAAMYIEG